MSQDNRLMPLSSAAGNIDRPLRDLAQPVQVTGSYAITEPTHLRDYLNVVLKRKWLILSLITVVTTLVAIQMYRLPSTYEAKTVIQIEQKNRTYMRTKDLVINAGADPAYWNTQLKLLENPSLHRQVILALNLQNNPVFLGGQARTSLFTTLRRVLVRDKVKPTAAPGADGGLTVANETVPGEDAKLTPEQLTQLEPFENALAAGLTVDPEERTNLVDIRYQHTDPELARRIADTLAAVFIENDRQHESAGTEAAKKATAEQINELQAQVAMLEKQRMNAVLAAGQALSPEVKGVNEIAERVAILSQQSLEAESETKKLQAEFDAAQKAQAASDIFSIPKVQADKQVETLQSKLAELNEQRAALLEKYTSEWPAVKQIDAQIAQTEAARNRAAKAKVAALSADLDAAKRRESSLKSAYETQRNRANAQGIQAITQGNVEQQLETSKQMLKTLLQRRTELQTADVEGQQPNVSIQTPARTPALVGPPRVRNIIIALLLSLGAGIGLAFLLDYLDDTLKSVEDVDRHVRLPTLALIPAPREVRRLFGRNGPVHEPSDNTALALIEEVRSPVAEAYRHLRTSLLLSSAGQPPKTVLVTSSQPSEGKTTTAVNTAMMLAQTGAEVLILDCDLRRPRVHMHFQLPNTRGVTNYLSGDPNIGSLIQTFDKQPNLKVITSGPVPPNAAELLGSEQMRRLLQQLGDQFTHIIIDSPPAISFTDASILSTMVDGVMLVVHGGRSSRAVVRRAKQQLLDVGAHLFGIVLNNVKLEASDYYYGYGYYSNYYSQDDDGGGVDDTTAAAGANGRGA
jgi:capsular exopolysaccharide synthesis family protein